MIKIADTSLKKYKETPKYGALMKAQSTQKSFVSDNGILCMSKAGERVPLTLEEKNWNAEILFAVNVVKNNYSFISLVGENQLYRQMFLDSDIAESFQQADTNVRYVKHYRIKPYAFNLVLTDLKDQPFHFHFDETTASQVKKLYDAYPMYWGAKSNKIIFSYMGSLIVEHGPAAHSIQHFQTLVSKLSLDVCLLMNLGMDGPMLIFPFKGD